ncbi:hypothetical protein POJ06DRAFT_269065 [Lipomyces tetrasporus]|uniref:Uncharacterized protein n=1 Tax=Lipomyces tetrasporus TaxID=54092 RepID=A0AAD7QP43_9ASCO|nr:uncharacterized protein POJ06DRAFT_269065 [Lipomyces tetrasporus]KAJ8098997.1 hypothetical protein POJ06DRAFT_269065 [Lipomyces tetrasporus]
MVNLRDVSISNSNLKTNTPGMVALFVEGKEQKLDLVFLSAGYLSVAGRQETSEGVDTFCSLAYYGRLRIIDNLLPLLCASLNPRVHFHAGKELAVNLDDLELRNRYSFINAVNSATTQTTLAFEELAKVYPMINGDCYGYLEVAGDSGKMDSGSCTTSFWEYPPAEPKDPHEVGVALPDGVDVAKSSVVTDGKGNGVYRIDNYGESVENECDKILADYRARSGGEEGLGGD